MKTIEITIDENGNVTLETKGFSGKSCIKESQIIKELLGEEMSRQLTPAYYAKEAEKTKTKRYLPLCG